MRYSCTRNGVMPYSSRVVISSIIVATACKEIPRGQISLSAGLTLDGILVFRWKRVFIGRWRSRPDRSVADGGNKWKWRRYCGNTRRSAGQRWRNYEFRFSFSDFVLQRAVANGGILEKHTLIGIILWFAACVVVDILLESVTKK